VLNAGSESKSRWERARDAQLKKQEEAATRVAEEESKKAQEEAEAKLARLGFTTQEHHQVQNTNREDQGESASGVDAAINVLSDSTSADTNVKMTFDLFLEREAPILRKENPGLRFDQVRDRVFKMWKRSAENPANQQPQQQQG